MVLEQQRHAGGLGLRRGARQHLDDVAPLRLDEVGPAGELGAVEARDDAQDRASDRHGAFEPGCHPPDADCRLVTVSRLPEEVARGEELHAMLGSSLGQARELAGGTRARVVEVDLHALGTQRGRLVDHVLERQLAVLEPEVPAERVDAELDRHRRPL